MNRLRADRARVNVGGSFFEPTGDTILRFDNASDTEPVETICFYLTAARERPAIEMLAGGMERQRGVV